MFYDNLKSICEEKKIKITPLILSCGGTKGVISGWKKGASPNSDIVMKLAVQLNVPTDRLLFGDKQQYDSISDDVRELLNNYNNVDDTCRALIRERAAALAEKAKQHKQAVTTPIKHTDKTVLIPEKGISDFIYLDFPENAVSAGTGEYLTGSYTIKLRVPSTELTRQADYALRVSGDSMQPDYLDGDIVLVSADDQLRIGDVGIFILNNEGYIKEYGGDRLISYNDKYRDIVFKDGDECRSCGKVIGKLEDKNDN